MGVPCCWDTGVRNPDARDIKKNARFSFVSKLRRFYVLLPSTGNTRLISLEGYMRTPIETMLARARVLACPTRLTVWFSLGRDGMRPSEVARMHGVVPSTVTYHLSMLKREKLVEVVGAGKWRLYRQTDVEMVLATRAELEAARMLSP